MRSSRRWARFPPERLRELAEVAVVERAARGSDPLAAHKGAAQSVFLLRGEVLLMFEGGGTLVVVGGTGDGRHAAEPARDARRARAAITDVELLASTTTCSTSW